MTTFLFAGHSHTRCFNGALKDGSDDVRGTVAELLDPVDPQDQNALLGIRALLINQLYTATGDDRFSLESSVGDIRAAAADQNVHIALALGGNEYVRSALFTALPPDRGWVLEGDERPAGHLVVPRAGVRQTIHDLLADHFSVAQLASDWFHRPILQLAAPPPLDDIPERESMLNELVGFMLNRSEYANSYRNLLPEMGHDRDLPEDMIQQILPLRRTTPQQMQSLWNIQSEVVAELCDANGVRFVDAPVEARTETGFLRGELAADLVHANEDYGHLVIADLVRLVEDDATAPAPLPLVEFPPFPPANPYMHAPDTAFWRRSVAEVPAADIDPVSGWVPTINRRTRIATVGSCFAQNISRYLKAQNFNFLDVEPRPPLISTEVATSFNYGQFSARYGNVYTSRQLVQLLERSLFHGENPERDNEVWRISDTRWVDPFRPKIHPEGFDSPAALRQDRRRHLAAVSAMLQRLDVLVITLGLTEAWINRNTGAAYPLAPGVAGGRFDPNAHEFVNLTVDDVRDDVARSIELLRSVNPDAEVVLTVSPVPLIATASDDHVLAATTYSKSVLRVAAGQISNEVEGVSYFPSYEIITGAFNRGRYFGGDLRSATDEGVDHAMRLFFRHSANLELVPITGVDRATVEAQLDGVAASVVCDHEDLDAADLTPSPSPSEIEIEIEPEIESAPAS